VKFHLTNVYRKLGVKSRTEAIHRAYQLGLVERPNLDE
jgi:DNA-binding CsgD family transcriptional regulator